MSPQNVFIKSFGKAYKVGAIVIGADAANAWTEQHSGQSVIACNVGRLSNLVLIAETNATKAQPQGAKVLHWNGYEFTAQSKALLDELSKGIA